MSWIKRLFKRERNKGYCPPRARTLYDFLTIYTSAKHEKDAMWNFVRHHADCEDIPRLPSKKLMRQYGIYPAECNGFAWYLLEKWSEGKIEIKP